MKSNIWVVVTIVTQNLLCFWYASVASPGDSQSHLQSTTFQKRNYFVTAEMQQRSATRCYRFQGRWP